MMKLLCLVLLVCVLAYEIEGWRTRRWRVRKIVRVPRVRRVVPRIRLRRFRVRRLRPRLRFRRRFRVRRLVPGIRLRRLGLPSIRRIGSCLKPALQIYKKLQKTFYGAYKRVCGDRKRHSCGFKLYTRARSVCSGLSCFKRNFGSRFGIGKRSIEFDAGMADSEKTNSKRGIATAANIGYTVYKGVTLHQKCCKRGCLDAELAEYCISLAFKGYRG
ncbi:uncharacterized protein LOC114541882 [Dendronephthya gigantea]|uniref:uncharacterized protein LOC114541882 n=1 Tax=Dendronephthya gigantea TaxID=151771 RepID=UPI00106D82D9|nr:uncharacterized protein LOC114541882 [Dendronephthya gigantea]